MNGAKSIFTSITFWATVLTAFSTFFPTVYGKLGITDQTAAVSHIVNAIGYCLIVYGRFRATKAVTLFGKTLFRAAVKS